MKCDAVTNGQGCELEIPVSASHTLGNPWFALPAYSKHNNIKYKDLNEAPRMGREPNGLDCHISASGENAHSDSVLLAQ